MTGPLALHFVLGRCQCMMLRRQFRVIGQCQFAPVFKTLGLQWRDSERRHQRVEVFNLQRVTQHRFQFTQRSVLIVLRFDFLRHGHAQARAGFQHIGARSFATFEQTLVQLQALGIGALLRTAQLNVLAGQQRLAVGT